MRFRQTCRSPNRVDVFGTVTEQITDGIVSDSRVTFTVEGCQLSGTVSGTRMSGTETCQVFVDITIFEFAGTWEATRGGVP